MNKKGLSILLALSMVFSLNTFAFAEEAVVTDEAVVEAVAEDDVEVTQSQSSYEWSQSLDKFSDQTSFKDYVRGKTTISVGSALKLDTWGVTVHVPVEDEVGEEAYQRVYGVAFYNGKKLTPDRLGGLYVSTLDGKYSIDVKSIKLKNAKATSTGTVQFTLKSIYGFKDLEVDGHENPNWLTSKDAKTEYKTIKAAFKAAKSQVFTAYIAPTYVADSISESALKSLKKAAKSLSAGEIQKLAEDWGISDFGYNDDVAVVCIKTKNGSAKKAQLVFLEKKNLGKHYGDVYKVKVKTRNLKSGKDFTADGDGIKFDNLDTYTANGTIKAKT